VGDKRIIGGIGCFLGVVLLAFFALSGGSANLDHAGVLAFRDTDDLSNLIGPDWLKIVFTGITHLGAGPFLILLSLLAVIFSYRKWGQTYALKLMFAFSGVFALTPVLKALFARARPDIVPQFVHATSASFPSGHTLRSTVVYFLVVFLLTRGHTQSGSQRLWYTLTALLIALIGLSRVVLGVHWPTDIIAGWLIGTGWVLMWSKYLTVDK